MQLLIPTGLVLLLLVGGAHAAEDPADKLLDYWMDTGAFSDQQDPLDRIQMQQRWLLAFRDRVLSPQADDRSVRAMLLLAQAAQMRRDAMTLEFLADMFLPLYRMHGEQVVHAVTLLPFLARPVCRLIAAGHASDRDAPDRAAITQLRMRLLQRLKLAGATIEAIRACRSGIESQLQSDSTNSL